MSERLDPGLRRSVTWTAAVAALATAMIVPGLYFLTAYLYESERMTRDARRAASSISRQIYLNPEVWRFDLNSLEDAVFRVQQGGAPIAYRVTDAAGEAVHQFGAGVVESSVTKSAELGDGVTIVGSLAVTESIRGVWLRTGLAAILGALLGLGAFASLQILPLRALTRALQRLEASKAELFATQEELLRKERLATLGQLTATVSHELRNPLGTIRTTVSTIGDKIREKGLGMERPLRRIERNILRCDDIISDLLDYSRTRQLAQETVSLDRLLEEIAKEHSLPEGVALCFELAADARIEVDLERFRRVLINLLDNACQAMAEDEDRGFEAGGGTISLRSRATEERVEVSISDSGCGMPADVLAKAFEPLFSTKSFGVGLGLPIVSQIMQQHGGGVEIFSEDGGGTEVRLWLPLRHGKIEAAA